MSDLLAKDLVSYNPLSEITRRERRSLLGLSILAIALVKVPLVPEKINAIGIDLALKNQQTFLFIYSLILLYYISAFAIYGFTDYIAWRRAEVIALREYSRQEVFALQAMGQKGEKRLANKLKQDPVHYIGFASYYSAKRAARIRVFFEFAVPLITAVYAVVVLLQFGW